jgi:hypothetical protein
VRARSVAADAIDLGGGDDAAVAAVTLDVDTPGTVPAPQRVEADAQRRRRLARGVDLLRQRQLSGLRSGIA